MANNADNFVKPIAEGLKRMFSRLGVESTVFYDGLYFLDQQIKKRPISLSKQKDIIKYIYQRYFSTGQNFFKKRLNELCKYNLIVVVETMPTA